MCEYVNTEVRKHMKKFVPKIIIAVSSANVQIDHWPSGVLVATAFSSLLKIKSKNDLASARF